MFRLYDATKGARLRERAQHFLAVPGTEASRYDESLRGHKPVHEKTEAVRRVVRAMYLYCGMAESVLAEVKPAYMSRTDALWQGVVDAKTYLSGGIGCVHETESFGGAYQLPNKTAYYETCGTIGNVLWNHRMFRLTGDDWRYVMATRRDRVYVNLYTALVVKLM